MHGLHRAIFMLLTVILAGQVAYAMGEKPMAKPEKIKLFDVRQNKTIEVEEIVKSDAEWKKELTPDQYEVTNRQGTERPLTCTFEKIKENGRYRWVRCGTDLFRAGTKFESGTG